jgi:hypothetical protein
MTVPSSVVVQLSANSVTYFEKSGIFSARLLLFRPHESPGGPFEKFDAAFD